MGKEIAGVLKICVKYLRGRTNEALRKTILRYCESEFKECGRIDEAF
jgi:hypothetical protein